jgi:hypothetical protein
VTAAELANDRDRVELDVLDERRRDDLEGIGICLSTSYWSRHGHGRASASLTMFTHVPNIAAVGGTSLPTLNFTVPALIKLDVKVLSREISAL